MARLGHRVGVQRRRLSVIAFVLWLVALQLAALIGTYLLARLWL